MEYKNTADSIQDVIDRLKAEKEANRKSTKKNLIWKLQNTRFIIMNAFTFQIILWIDITEHDKMKENLYILQITTNTD